MSDIEINYGGVYVCDAVTDLRNIMCPYQCCVATFREWSVEYFLFGI